MFCTPQDIISEENKIILKWSDGKESHIWADIRPLVIQDNTIKLDYRLVKNLHSPGAELGL